MAGFSVASRHRRPTVSLGSGGLGKHRPLVMPSLIDGTGRSTIVNFSGYDGSIIGGAEFSGPQRYSFGGGMWHNYHAGGGVDGSIINPNYKSTAGFVETSSHGIWLTGANSDGAIMYRRPGVDTQWNVLDSNYCGAVDDGGTADPRRVGSRNICIRGNNVWVACEEKSSGFGGITFAQWDDFDEAWGGPAEPFLFDEDREITAIVSSPSWGSSALYVTGGYRCTNATSEGVYILTNITSPSGPTLLKIDNRGAEAPSSLVDVRDAFACKYASVDYLFVVVGNRDGGDGDRGIWRATIFEDPEGEDFDADDSIAWKKIYTPDTNERMNTICGYQPNGTNTAPIHLMSSVFKPTTTSTGTWTTSTVAGSSLKSYRVSMVRSLNVETESPTNSTAITNSTTVQTNVFGQPSAHTWGLIRGGTSNIETSRMGGTGWAPTGMAASSDGLYVVVAGRGGPWICTDPWNASVSALRWYPLVDGFGSNSGEYDLMFTGATGTATTANRFVCSEYDSTEGLATFGDAETWCDNRKPSISVYGGGRFTHAGDSDGSASCASVAMSIRTPGVILVGRSNGNGYSLTNGFVYSTATGLAVSVFAIGTVTSNLKYIDFLDNLGRGVELGFAQAGIYKSINDGALSKTGTLTSVSPRADVMNLGSGNILAHYPDLGVYRSTDYGDTWTLVWNNPVATNMIAYCGHSDVNPNATTVMWSAFANGGIYKTTDPATTFSSALNVGGSIDSSTLITAIAVDPIRGDVWALSGDVTAATLPGLHYLPSASGSTWIEWEDTEITEGASSPLKMIAYDGQVWFSTQGEGILRLVH